MFEFDLDKGQEFYDAAPGREMLIKNWSDGSPWLFYKHPDGDWVSLRAATDEDLELLYAAYQEAMAHSGKSFDAYAESES